MCKERDEYILLCVRLCHCFGNVNLNFRFFKCQIESERQRRRLFEVNFIWRKQYFVWISSNFFRQIRQNSQEFSQAMDRIVPGPDTFGNFEMHVTIRMKEKKSQLKHFQCEWSCLDRWLIDGVTLINHMFEKAKFNIAKLNKYAILCFSTKFMI